MALFCVLKITPNKLTTLQPPAVTFVHMFLFCFELASFSFQQAGSLTCCLCSPCISHFLIFGFPSHSQTNPTIRIRSEISFPKKPFLLAAQSHLFG